MSQPRPSVAIVTRLTRAASFLDRVLDGLLLQKGAALTWVIVKNIPLSEAHEACLSRARENGLHVVVKQVQAGLSLGQLANIGVQATKSDFILLHDDDDALAGNFVGRALNAVGATNFVGAVCHAALIYEAGDKKRLHFVLSPGRKQLDSEELAQDNLIATNALIFLRSAFDRTGGYPEDVPVAEDWLFNLSLIGIGPIAVIPDVLALVYIRQSASDNDRNANTNREDHIRLARQIRADAAVSKPSLEQRQRRFFHKIMRFIDRVSYRLGIGFLPRF